MPAIAIQLDCVAATFAACAAILAAFRSGATARRILACFVFIVGHSVPPSKLKLRNLKHGDILTAAVETMHAF